TFLEPLENATGVAIVSVTAHDALTTRRVALSAVHAALEELTGFSSVIWRGTNTILAAVLDSLPIELTTIAVDRVAKNMVRHSPPPLPFDVVHPQKLFSILASA